MGFRLLLWCRCGAASTQRTRWLEHGHRASAPPMREILDRTPEHSLSCMTTRSVEPFPAAASTATAVALSGTWPASGARTVPAMPTGESLPTLRHRQLPAGAMVVVVRGDDTDPEADRRQAEAFLRRWPDWHRYGLSAYYAEDDDALPISPPTSWSGSPCSGSIALMPSSRLASRSSRRFRSPHVTLACVDLEPGLGALESVEHEIRPNPYHER